MKTFDDESNYIKTPRLTLRSFKKEDAKQLHSIFANEEAMRYWSTPPHKNLIQTQEFVDNTITKTRENSGEDFVVLYKDRIVGKAGLWNNSEVGFIFSPLVWNKGIANEALQAVITRAKAKGIPTIFADVDPRNESCIKLLLKNKFVLTGKSEGTLQVNGIWVDSLYFQLQLTQ